MITEMSISWEVSDDPVTPLNDRIVWMVDPRGKHTERAISSKHLFGLQARGNSLFDIPDWLIRPRTNNLRFVYETPLQNIECTYYSKYGVLKCSKIKYGNMDTLLSSGSNLEPEGRKGCIDGLFAALKVTPKKAMSYKYKATGIIRIDRPWNKEVFADVITNNPDVAKVMALCEQMSTLKHKRLFSMVVDAGNTVRVTMTANEKERGIVVMMSRLEDESTLERVMSALEEVVDIYTKNYDDITEAYRGCCTEVTFPPEVIKPAMHVVTGIKMLRQELPSLFINNYTRECPVLPIMISKDEADRIRDTHKVIFYPLDSEHGRYYTAPDGYYVGLKRNRLRNKDLFPCLITCYLCDHMDRPGSETHTYYTKGSLTLRTGARRSSSKPVPRSIVNEGADYVRIRIESPSFVSALETATGEKICDFPWCPQLTKQELWDEPDDAIMEMVMNGNRGSSVFRYFEELLGMSIHVIVIKNGRFQEMIPDHKGPYIWTYPYPCHVVIFEKFKTTYGRTVCWYEVLARSKSKAMLFPTDDPVVSSIIYQKTSASVRGFVNSDAEKQLIDDNGKCRIVELADGSRKTAFYRPLASELIKNQTCFYDDHITKLNDCKRQMGIGTICLNKRSDNNVKYFPNDASFEYWYTASLGGQTWRT